MEKYLEVVKNLEHRKEQVGHDTVQSGHRSEKVEELLLDLQKRETEAKRLTPKQKMQHYFKFFLKK